jgi:hypothetical protein
MLYASSVSCTAGWFTIHRIRRSHRSRQKMFCFFVLLWIPIAHMSPLKLLTSSLRPSRHPRISHDLNHPSGMCKRPRRYEKRDEQQWAKQFHGKSRFLFCHRS